MDINRAVSLFCNHCIGAEQFVSIIFALYSKNFITKYYLSMLLDYKLYDIQTWVLAYKNKSLSKRGINIQNIKVTFK